MSDLQPIPILDSHQHFWRFEPVRDQWITDEMIVLRRDFLPQDLQENLFSTNVMGTIAVQSDQSDIETEFLLNLSTHNPFIQGVVGWVDLMHPALPLQLKQ